MSDESGIVRECLLRRQQSNDRLSKTLLRPKRQRLAIEPLKEGKDQVISTLDE